MLFYFTSYVLNMFRTLICPSSGACSILLNYHIGHIDLGSNQDQYDQCGNSTEYYKLLMMDILMSETCWAHKKWNKIASDIKLASACNTDTTPTQPHGNSNTHGTKNNATNVVIQQNSRKLLMMDTLISETYWVHKTWNKIASDIKLVFYSSTITMMHGPINIRFAV